MNKKWDNFYNRNGRFYMLPHVDIEKAISEFKSANALHVLDVGCGSGINTIELAEANFIVTGIDYSTIATHLAEHWLREKQLPGKIYVCDFRSGLKVFRDREFDAIFCANSLQYCLDDSEISNVLAEFNRILSDDGRLFAVVPTKFSVILQPDTSQIYFDDERVRKNFTQYFEITEQYVDDEKAIVVLGRKRMT